MTGADSTLSHMCVPSRYHVVVADSVTALCASPRPPSPSPSPLELRAVSAALAALNGLELLVCIDIKMAATAKLADYVIAPKICLEREDVTLLTDIWYDKAYSQYTQTVVEAEGDQIEEY